jgi:4'-phosphopantetheinyl transferase
MKTHTLYLFCEKLICSDAQLAYYQKILSPEELMRASKFIKKIDQHKFIIAKGRTREILSTHLEKNPADIQFEFGEHGKPFVKNSALQFNTSDSGDYFFMGVTEGDEIGVDIEYIREQQDYFALAKRFFTASEFHAIKNKNDFYRVWTCKEAFIKATGLGLSFGLSNFEIDFFDEKSALKSVHHDENAAKKWMVKSIPLHFENYFAAIAINAAHEKEVSIVFKK